MGCHALLQGIFLTQGSKLCLLSVAMAGGFFTISTTWEVLLQDLTPSQLPNQGGDCHQTWEQPAALRAPGSPPWARVHLHRAVMATAQRGSSPQATGHTQTAQGCLLRRTCLQGRHRRQLHFVSQRKLNKMRRQRGRFQIKEQKNNP